MFVFFWNRQKKCLLNVSGIGLQQIDLDYLMDTRIRPLEQNLCERDWRRPHDDCRSNEQTCNDFLELKNAFSRTLRNGLNVKVFH